jgi:hypothetical protein
MRYRDMPQFVMRRIDNVAAEMNGFLVIVAIGLAMLDLLCLMERFVDSLPSAVQVPVH